MIATQSVSAVAYQVAPFIQDNTGRNITQFAATSVQTAGTYSIYCSTQNEYRNFTSPLVGVLNLVVSTASAAPYVNSTINITAFTGAGTASIVLGNQMTTSTSKTISVPANTNVRISGLFNGNTFVNAVTLGL